LSARQAELAGVAGSAPGGLVFTQGTQTLGDFPIVEPFDGRSCRAQESVDGWTNCAAPAQSSPTQDQAEGVPGRDMEFARPVAENDLIVWKKTPKKRINLSAGVFCQGERHREPLERVSILLGHQSVRITEKHYTPWVKARQEQLEADVRRT
jgi:hypothetical protein